MAIDPKILIADDDRTVTALLRAALSPLGYEVVVADNGERAWQLLQQPGAPQLAILDWLMPGISGVDVCRKVRERQDAPYVYIILLTGMDKLDDVVKGMEAGADDYIIKPFAGKELEVRLRAGWRILDLQDKLLAAHNALEIRASHDGLTGLWNHGAIIERLAGELDRATREKTPLGVILFDLDHFKQINDTYGHSVGDLVLCESARRIKASVRPYDLVGRYGGEEFLTVLPNCDVRLAAAVAERVREAMIGTSIITPAGQLFVTVSGGVGAAMTGDIVEASKLIDAADRALYRAKNTGRNRIGGLVGEDGDSLSEEFEGSCAI